MTKDVTHSTLTDISVQFTPAVIEVDREAMEAQVAAVVAQYSGQEVTFENYKSVYAERTRFNKLIEKLDRQRKDFTGKINEPAKEFDSWVKEKIISPIEEVTAAITVGLNAIDEQERILRLDTVRVTFEDKCMVAGLEKSTFADKYSEYSLKKYFKTGKIELKKSTLDEFDALVLSEFDALEEYKASKQAIIEQAKEYDLPVDSYIRHLEDGKPLVDIFKIMKSDRDAVALRREQEEAQAKAEVERKAEIERLAKEQANESIKAIDAETGEIIDDFPQEINETVEVTEPTPSDDSNVKPTEPVEVVMLLTLHGGQAQLDKLKEYLEDNFIGFETLGTT